MDHILVTPEMISGAASSCDTTAGEIDNELAALRSFVVNLQGIWHGVAAGQFEILMNDFDAYGRMLHNALTDIASGLRGNFHNYVDAEQSNVSTLVAVDNIPAAKF